jgi:hypothetical protein
LGRYDLKELGFLEELTPEFLKRFEDKFTVRGSSDLIPSASVIADCHSHCFRPLQWISHWAQVKEGDGLVPRESQVFGKVLGEFDLDHLSEVSDDTAKRPERLKMLRAISTYWESLGELYKQSH